MDFSILKTMKRLQTGAKTNIKTQPKASVSHNAGAAKANSHFLSLEESMKDKSLQVYKDDRFVCIRDKYPKARIHLLLIPLEAATPGVKLAKVEQVVRLPNVQEFLQTLSEISTKIIDQFICKSTDSFPHKKDLICGFHSVQSMQPLHMHIISNDFQSACLKNKKHWNSFNTEYFICLNDLISHLKNEQDYFLNDKFNLKNRGKLDEYLKSDLKCNKCHKSIKNIPELKKHLDTHN